MIIDKVIFIHIYRLLQEKMRNPATAGFAGVLFPKIVWLLSALNLCVKNGTTILGDNLTDFFIGYGVFVLSLTDIALAVNYKPVFKTEQTFEEVSREFYFHPSRCKVLIGIYLVLTIGERNMISRIRRFWWAFTMMHKIAFTLSLEMLKRKGV